MVRGQGEGVRQEERYEVEVVTIPYQGYEAKYLAGFMATSSARHVHGHDAPVVRTVRFLRQDARRPREDVRGEPAQVHARRRQVEGRSYGIPIEHGNFQQMYINVDMFRKAGLNPDDPPKSFDKWLADLKKLTIADAKGGEPTQVGFAIRSKGAPVGITDKFPPVCPCMGCPDAQPGDGQGQRLCQ